MKILFYRYGSICEPDFMEAFQALGFEVDLDETEIQDKTVTPAECITRVSPQIMENNYVFVFSINFYPWLSNVCEIAHVPYVCQIVDSPILELYSDAVRNSCNRIFIFDQQQYEDFVPLNPDHIFHLPLSANTRHFDQVIGNTDDGTAARYQSDISFIGSTYQEKCALNQIHLPAQWQGYVDGLVEAQLRVYGYNFIRETLPDELVSCLIKENPDIYHFPETSIQAYKEMIADQFISVKVGEQERIRALQMLSNRFHVDFYTGSDTSQMPKIHNRGFARSQTEMPLIFHNSKINLNITAKSIRSGLSQRVFDVLGCGGFLITNYQTELADSFEIGHDLVAYGNLNELQELCQYYLNHEEERIEIARNGYNKVKAMHDNQTRLLQILDLAFPQKK